MHLQYNHTIQSLPFFNGESFTAIISDQLKIKDKIIIVLDDDPTGTQTMHHIPVLTTWDEASIKNEIELGTPLFYILTNSRSLPAKQANELNYQIGSVIAKVFKASNKQYIVISRSDSTLRGHYPNEVNALANGLGATIYHTLIIPAFFEGERFTINDVHYVKEADNLIPAAETAFAKDKAFGFKASNLKEWVEEKTNATIHAVNVISFSIQELRDTSVEQLTNKIQSLPPSSTCVVNAVNYYDIEKFALAYLHSNVEVIFRTAASFVKAISGTEARKLISKNELTISNNNVGGLIIVGSYVPKTTKQLHVLLANKNLLSLEINIDDILESKLSASIITAKVEQLISSNNDVVIYTSRALKEGINENESLAIGNRIADFITAIIRQLKIMPKFIIAKGGITSSDIATKALNVKRAIVLGQAMLGVPVWKLGDESKFPGMSYIIFPGNVGADNALEELYKILKN